jgi:amino acid transporter
VLLSLVALGSSVALNALLSLIIAALFSTYLLVTTLLLWRRTTGAIQPYVVGAESLDADSLAWGPWKLPEPFGVLNNVFACVYCVFLLFWSLWPQYTPTTPTTMNWSVLIWGFVVLASVTWWVLRARHYFKGPIREV